MEKIKTLEIGLCEDFDGEGCGISSLIENGIYECESYVNGRCQRYCGEMNIKQDEPGKFYIKTKLSIS